MSSTSPLAGRRAVFVLNWAALGGAEQFALDTATYLRDEGGAHVAICALTDADGRAREAAAGAGIPWVPLPLAWSGGRAAKIRALARLTKSLRSFHPDVVVPVCAVPNVLCSLIWRATGARACVWNQRDVAVPSRFGLRTIRIAIRRATLAVACADHVAAFLAGSFHADPRRIRVAPTGVELRPAEHGRDDWRSSLGLEPDDVAVSMLAHLHRFKDHATLIRAWRVVQDGVAVDGSRAADIGVLSSRAEGLARSVLEFMAGGHPVAGTDIEGIREAVGRNGSSFLAPPGDHAALAAILLRLIGDGELRLRVGEANAAHGQAAFSSRDGKRLYAQVLADVLDCGPGPDAKGAQGS
jgi:Glycosyl transferases group 1/Glycosyltransferase Family 4